MKLTFNFSFNEEGKMEQAKEKQQKAQTRKSASEETLQEARSRILSLKNSNNDTEKLTKVLNGLEDGTLKREDRYLGKKLSKAELLRYYSLIQESVREEKIRELVEKTPSNYRLITTEEDLNWLITSVKNEPYIAMDTETTGLDIIFGEDELVGISITLPSQEIHTYIPVFHDCGGHLERELVLNALKPLLEDPSIGKVFHNYKFDGHVLKNYDITIQNMFHDTQIAQHILNENENSLALKELVTKYLKLPSDTFGTLFGNDTPFNTLPLDVALVYAAKDSDITNQLYIWQMNHFKRLPNLLDYYKKVENPLIEVLIDMERTGFTLDKEYAEKYRIELEIEIKELETELETYFGGINLQSPVQLKAKLEEITGKKLESTDAKKVLKPLKDKYVEIATLLKYKDLVKLHSTYVDALPKKVKGDGRIHPSFGQSNTVTGRLNSSNPNFQNLGERARKMFIAPKGKVILAGDFS